jgi:hypothetical protein
MSRAWPLGLIILFGGLGGPPAWAETYEWRDDKGVFRVSDQIPPDHAKYNITVRDPHGNVLRIIEGAKTREQLHREEQIKKLRNEQERILSSQRERDLTLLRTYGTEEEIQSALKSTLDALNLQIQNNRINRERQVSLLEGYQKQAADLERQGKEVSPSLREAIDGTHRSMALLDAKIRDFEARKVSERERFEKELIRFRMIKSQQKILSEQMGLNLPEMASRLDKTLDIDSAYPCGIDDVCDQAWELARAYLLKHVPPPLAVDTEQILQTTTPLTDQQFSLTVTRTGHRKTTVLFLDARCRPTFAGEQLCAGPQIRGILSGFKSFVEAGLEAGAGTAR